MPRKQTPGRRWPATAFGTYIRRRRVELDLRQEDVAEMLSVHPTYVSQLENGRPVEPGRRFIERYAAALQIPTDVLIREGDLKRENLRDIEEEDLTPGDRLLILATRHLTDEQKVRLARVAEDIYGQPPLEPAEGPRREDLADRLVCTP